MMISCIQYYIDHSRSHQHVHHRYNHARHYYLLIVCVFSLTIGSLVLGTNGQVNNITEKPIVITSKPLIIKGPYIENCKTLRFDGHLFPAPCRKYNRKCGETTKNPLNCDTFMAKHQKNCDRIKLSRPNLYTKFCSIGDTKTPTSATLVTVRLLKQ